MHKMTDDEFEAFFSRLGFNLDKRVFDDIHAHRMVLEKLLQAIPRDLPFPLTPDFSHASDDVR